MGNLYNPKKLLGFLFVIFLFYSNNTLAQKVFRYRITNVNTNYASDCDGTLNDSDFTWWFDGGPSGNQCIGFAGNNGGINDNSNRDLFSGTYWSADCYTLGGSTFSYTFRSEEDDNAFFDDQACNDRSNACTHGTYTRTYPAYNAANGNTTIVNNASFNCQSGCDPPFPAGNAGIAYRYTSQWQISGAYAGSNLDANGYSNNKTCGTAINLNAGNRSNDVNQCTDAWYYYDVVATNLTGLNFTGANGTVTVWYDAGASCNLGCSVGAGGGGVNLGGPISTGRYYVRVSANGGRTNMNVSTTAGANSNNYIANATNMGTMPTTGGNLGPINDNNYGSNNESGESGLADNRTDWFKFTLTNPVPSYVDVLVESNGNDIDADFNLFKLNDNSYTFPRYCPNFSKLTYVGNGDGDDNIACRIDGTFESSLNSYRRFYCLTAGTYYVQVAGWRNNDLWPCDFEEADGDYRVTVSGSNVVIGPDNLCSAQSITTNIGINYNSGNIYFNNRCLGTQAGEPRTSSGNTMYSTAWYSFTTPATNVPVSITAEIREAGDDANNSAIAVYERNGSCAFGSLTEKAFNWWCNTDGGSVTVTCLKPSTTYYIQVGTAPNGNDGVICLFSTESRGNYYVRLTSSSVYPGPDNICDAEDRGTIALNATNTLYGNNSCATAQPGEVDVQEGPVSTTGMSPTKTTWYKFRTPATGGPYKANISSDYGFTDFDIEMALWSSPLGTCNFSDLVQMEWNDDITLLFNTKSAFTADCLPANTTFYLQVDGDDGGDYGNYQVTINIQATTNSAPPNDNLCNATNFGTFAYNTAAVSQSSDNECSSVEPGEPFYSGGFQAKYTTWHKFTINTDPNVAPAFMTIDADGTSGNQWYSLGHSTVSNIYKQNGTSSCPTNNMANISVVDYEDDNFILDADISNRTFCVEPGATYWVQVDGQTATNILLLNFDQQGNYNVSATPSSRYTKNDNICNAEDLGTLTFTTNLTIDRQNLCATNQAGEPFGTGSVQSNDHTVWFKFIAPSTNRPHSYKIDLEDLSGNILEFPIPRLYYDPTPATCGNFAELVSEENVEDEWQWSTEFPLDLADVTNQRYSCLVPGGTYYLQMTVRDGFAVAPVLGADNYMNFRLRITSDQEATATNDEPCTASWINTDGTIPAAPLPVNIPNQNFGTITAVNNQNNFCATAVNTFADLPTSDYADLDQTVWYKFKAPASGSVQFQITQPYDDAIAIQAAVYDPLFGCGSYMLEMSSMGKTALVDREIDWADNFYAHCLDPDSIYYLRVDGVRMVGQPQLNDEFRGKFRIEARDYDAWKAPNDRICDAISLGTPTPSGVSAKNVQYPSYAGVYPTNYCAGAYAEPVPTAFSPVNTVWYSFIAPPSGRVAIKALNDPANTGDQIWLRLAVWKTDDFTCTGTPTELASDIDVFDNDLCNLDNPTFGDAAHCIPLPCKPHRDEFISEVKCLDPGKRYYIMLDGWSYNNTISGCGDGAQDKYGRFDLIVYDLGGPAPNVSNDNACNAMNLGNPGNIPGNFVQRLNQNNSCATTEPGEPDPLGWDYNGGTSLNTSSNDGPQKTLWYKFVAPLTGSVTVQAWNTTSGPDNSLDLQLAVYDPGTNPCDITKFKEIKAQYDRLLFGAFGSKDEDMQVNCLTPGKTYYLQVDGDQTTLSCLDGGGVLDPGYLSGDNCIDGFFNLKITTALTGILATNNDNLCIAQNMGAVPNSGSRSTSTTESNWCSTEEIGEPNTSQTNNQYDPDYDETVWYRFQTGSNPGTITASITNATLLNALVFGGSFLITIYESKSNCPTTTCSGSTPNWNDLVMKANSNVILAPVSPFLSPANEELSMACAKPNWNYYIQIDAVDLPAVEFNIGGIQTHTQYGTFKLTVSSDGGGTPPLEDNPCNAVNLGTVPASGSVMSLPNRNNYCSGIDPGEPWVNGDPNDVNSINYDETVWYKFTTANTPGQSRNVRVRVDGDNLLDADPIDIGFVVYENGPACSPTACNATFPSPLYSGMREMDRADVPYIFDESVDLECLKPNTTYYIQIDGNDITGIGLLQLDKGNFTITVTDLGSGPIQNNDKICNATNMGIFTGGSQSFTLNTQSNACASEQGGEPNVSGGNDFSADNYDETVWYYFVTGTSPGEVTINVNGCPYASRWQGFTVYRGGPGILLSDCNQINFAGITEVGSTGISGCNPTMKLTCLSMPEIR